MSWYYSYRSMICMWTHVDRPGAVRNRPHQPPTTPPLPLPRWSRRCCEQSTHRNQNIKINTHITTWLFLVNYYGKARLLEISLSFQTWDKRTVNACRQVSWKQPSITLTGATTRASKHTRPLRTGTRTHRIAHIASIAPFTIHPVLLELYASCNSYYNCDYMRAPMRARACRVSSFGEQKAADDEVTTTATTTTKLNDSLRQRLR